MRNGSVNKKALITIVVILVLLVLCVAWFFRHRPPVAGAAVTPNPVVAVRPTRIAAPVVISAPLPAADVPLTQVFDELNRRAGQGDPAAACRLAIELERCDEIQQSLASYDEQLWRLQRAEENNEVDVADHQGRAAWKKMLDSMALGLVKQAERCEGIRPVSAKQRVALWRQSALAGNPGAVTHYVVGNAFRNREMLELLPELQHYRQEAETMALKAASRGDLQVSLALAAAYSPRRDTGKRVFLAQVVKPDVARSLTLYRRGSRQLPATAAPRARNVIDDNIAWLLQHATASDLSRAEALDQQWGREWASAPIDGSSQLTVSAEGGVADIAPSRCAD
ncbi:hypothetical protein [Xanthomonas arboricola]|uniref:hypothetical protein n=1 Tax=Xanthomonas arboricola TaxID=56448 RepID=UPI00129053F4|nr:hypothetical protein [Xanthomonas arboricola]